MSLNNNFSYVSQAGVSSILYFEPVNILYAEHQHWVNQTGEEFKKDRNKTFLIIPAVYDANDYSEIDKLIDKNDSDEQSFEKDKRIYKRTQKQRLF